MKMIDSNKSVFVIWIVMRKILESLSELLEREIHDIDEMRMIIS